MARGKHRARSAKKRTERIAGAAEELQARAAAELIKARVAEERARIVNGLRSEATRLEAAVEEKYAPAIASHISEIRAMQNALDELHATKAQKRDNDKIISRATSITGETLVELTERVTGSVVLVGVHQDIANKLPLEAVKAIQRARGARRSS